MAKLNRIGTDTVEIRKIHRFDKPAIEIVKLNVLAGENSILTLSMEEWLDLHAMILASNTVSRFNKEYDL